MVLCIFMYFKFILYYHFLNYLTITENTKCVLYVCVCFYSPHYTSLTFKRPTFAYMITHKKPLLEIHFKYLGIKEIYFIFEPCCIITVLFSTKCHLKLLFK